MKVSPFLCIFLIALTTTCICALPGVESQHWDETNLGDRKQQQQYPDIHKVHIVFSNHLDVGFDGLSDPEVPGFALNVINRYFSVYFPRAIQVINQRNLETSSAGTKHTNSTEQSAASASHPSFLYSTQAWLIDIYLNACKSVGVPVFANATVGLLCPSSAEQKLFEEYLNRGDLAYFAFPFNGEIEFGDASLLEAGLDIARRLDTQFSGRRTVSFSQRDVPGLTRAAVPIFAKQGIKFVSVGVNGGSAPPAVPRIFRWKDLETNTSVVACWIGGGYGTTIPQDAVVIPGFDQALIPAWRGDNKGPPMTFTQVIQTFATVQQIFPNAEVIASTFDDFYFELEKSPVALNQLPEVTDEIGDTWMYGTSSDPYKVALFRAFLRARNICLAKGACQNSDPQFRLFNLMLLKNVEHTWGMDVKTFLHDFENWTNVDFEKARSQPNYKMLETSWDEQRAYLTSALDHANPELKALITAEGLELVPKMPSTRGLIAESVASKLAFSSAALGFDIQFSSRGQITQLLNHRSNIQWATDQFQLLKILYRTYDASDYDSLFSTYSYQQASWITKDFGKPNVSRAEPESIFWPLELREFYRNEANTTFLLRIQVEDQRAHTYYGAPAEFWVSLNFETEGDFVVAQTQLQWFDKTPTRLPEAIFLQFNPQLTQAKGDYAWFMNKLNTSLVSPDHIVKNGSFELHGVFSVNAQLRSRDHQCLTSSEVCQRNPPLSSEKNDFFVVENVDSSLVNPGKPTAFPIPLQREDSNDATKYGMNFVLYDNLWGTNYIMWYPWKSGDENSKFRFKIKFR